MTLAAPLLVAFSYFFGSFPTAYLAGRFMKGIDIREYGSGNVGASNISVHVSRLAFLLVGPFDFLKGMVPVWAARRLGLSLGVGVIAGLASMVGHSWSLYLGFKGGRGISVGLGVMAIIAPLEFLLVLFILAVAIIMKNVPVGVGLGMASSPLLAWLFEEPAPATAGCGALALLTFAKRLLANREPLQGPKGEVLLNRLLFDRDVRDREEWIKRLPSERRRGKSMGGEIIEHFEGRISPYWVRFLLGRGGMELTPETALFCLEGAEAHELSDAEINDHRHRPRAEFPWRPPLRMEVRARFSHPSGELWGTAGFGFWNAPTDLEGRLLAPPNWIWFFYASPPSSVSLTPGQPGHGWKAAMLNSGQSTGPLLPLVNLISKVPLGHRIILWLAERALNMGDQALYVDMTEWHTYSLEWRPEVAIFQVDEREVLRVAKPPTMPLGFVAWMDNQRASMTPGGGLEIGLLAVPHRQWMEVDYIEIRGR